jgi:hypothetical protein
LARAPMGGVLPVGQEKEPPYPARPEAGQGPRGSSNQAATTLTPGGPAPEAIGGLPTSWEVGQHVVSDNPAVAPLRQQSTAESL